MYFEFPKPESGKFAKKINWSDFENSNAKRTVRPRAIDVGGALLQPRPTAAVAAEKRTRVLNDPACFVFEKWKY